MSNISGFSGADLLKVLKDLNIPLMNLHPNVIKGWFDTDFKDMRLFLHWMCSSLSTENYISPLEVAEYEITDIPFNEKWHFNEITKINNKYPDILKLGPNEAAIASVEEEIKLLEEENELLDEIESVEQHLQNILSKEVAKLTSEEFEVNAELSIQQHCLELSEKLDNVNEQLYNQSQKFSNSLENFEYAAVPIFINNIDIRQCEEYLECLTTVLAPVTDDSSLDTNFSLMSFTDGRFEENDQFITNVFTVRDRILDSRKILTVNEIQVAKYNAVLRFLQSYSTDSLLAAKENLFLSNQSKSMSQNKICEIFDNEAAKFADHCIGTIKYRYACEELKDYQAKLKNISTVRNLMRKLLAQYINVNTLHTVEQKDISDLALFFRKLYNYINGDMQKCLLRTDQMSEIISNYEEHIAKSLVDDECTFFKYIFSGIAGSGKYSLKSTTDAIKSIDNQYISRREFFACNAHKKLIPTTQKMMENIEKTHLFLSSGSTSRVEIIHWELKSVLNDIEDYFDKVDASIREVVALCNMKKKTVSKWDTYRNQLWIYFFANPTKMRNVFKLLEIEVNLIK